TRVGPFSKAPVVLISIDTLRSDHLPAYGYKEVKTPAIDSLVRDGILFERAYSHVPLTLPSHVTLLTGLLPTETGVRDNVGYHFDADKMPYLPRLLGRDGYLTGAAVSAFVLRAETGLAEGFDFYQSVIDLKASETLGRSQRPGTETLASAKPWLEKAAASGKPFFFFFHIYEPHRPYDPPEPFASRYGKTYDGEIASADAVIGDLFHQLRQLGVFKRSIIVLLSDHGEGLEDHGEQGHGILLYREALQVPLIVKLPEDDLAGSRVASPAELSDITPTVLSLVGLVPPKGENGRDLFALSGRGSVSRAIYSETYYPRIHMGWSQLTSIIRGKYQLIWGPDPELYDLAQDPQERHNLFHRDEKTATSLRQALRPYLKPLAPPSAASAETSQRLAALGYLSGSAKLTASEGPLPDPKAKIGTLKSYSQALRLFTEQKFAQAVPLYRELVKEEPKMLDAWENLGSALQKLGRRQEALTAYEEAMKVSGGAPNVALRTASVLFEMHRYDEARKYAELELATSPARAHNFLAQIEMAQGDLAKAETEAQAAIAIRGSGIGPLVTLAACQGQQGEIGRALATIATAEETLGGMEGPKRFPGLFLLKGELLTKSGDLEAGEKAFKREVATYPEDSDAYLRLAALYATQGRGQAAVDTLHQMIDKNPDSPAAYGAAVKGLRMLGDPRSANQFLNMAMHRFPDSELLRGLAKEK
ncbi:MAG TPA: sulfatase-like hydrolase/transferase, partial [Thermoanaerobaculia bacterium]|nr:sulfatase-like hydrolase/transferase [Thermoanaerobaculia bacterium]